MTYARKMAHKALHDYHIATVTDAIRAARNEAEFRAAEAAAEEEGTRFVEAVVNEVIEACARECETWRGGGPLTNEVAMRIRRLATTKEMG